MAKAIVGAATLSCVERRRSYTSLTSWPIVRDAVHSEDALEFLVLVDRCVLLVDGSGVDFAELHNFLFQ